MTIGLVAAMPAELKCLDGRNYLLNQPFHVNRHLLAIISGIGANHARRAAELLQYHHINGLISWGTAADLGGTGAGDLILPEKIIGRNGKEFHTDQAWRNHLHNQLQNIPAEIHTGPLAETRLMLELASQKKMLQQETGAIAADMESASVARVAQENRLPCLVIRTVVDRHDQALPYAITRHTDMYGKADISRLLLEVLLNPRLLPQVLQLGRGMQKAMATLRSVARQGQDILGTFY